jgi:hypothetical protein
VPYGIEEVAVIMMGLLEEVRVGKREKTRREFGHGLTQN